MKGIFSNASLNDTPVETVPVASRERKKSRGNGPWLLKTRPILPSRSALKTVQLFANSTGGRESNRLRPEARTRDAPVSTKKSEGSIRWRIQANVLTAMEEVRGRGPVCPQGETAFVRAFLSRPPDDTHVHSHRLHCKVHSESERDSLRLAFLRRSKRIAQKERDPFPLCGHKKSNMCGWIHRSSEMRPADLKTSSIDGKASFLEFCSTYLGRRSRLHLEFVVSRLPYPSVSPNKLAI